MPRQIAATPRRRVAGAERLSRERIVAAAIELADRGGIDSLSMRKLAQQLGVDPMSLYNHVSDKDDLLSGIVDGLVTMIEPTTDASDWMTNLRQTILAARQTLLRHPWSSRVIESRVTPTPATLRYLDTVVGILRDGGFSLDLRHHSLHVLGSRILGFSQDLFDDSPDVRPEPEVAAMQARMWATTHPDLALLAGAVTHDGGLGGCDDDEEFAFSLELILEGLERRRILLQP
jgi:AcrR family transcriptional regulator